MNIVSTLDLNPTTHLNVRHAFEKDEELLLKWANDPIVRSNGFNTGKISPSCVFQNWEMVLKTGKNSGSLF